ncbi:MAG: single-stranded DNA-binding protein [Planctomycetota bacterium]|jgi:single-strand DNA-binding protein
MADFNKVILMGRLTRDPEMRYTPSGMALTKIGLAVGRRYFNKNSQQTVEETTFVDCESWGKQAETINQYMKKGRPIFIEGRLKFDSWETKEGQRRSKLGVVIENFQFMDSGGGGNAQGGSNAGGDEQRRARGGGAPEVRAGNVSDRGSSASGSPTSGSPTGGSSGTGSGGGGEDYDFEDIPF